MDRAPQRMEDLHDEGGFERARQKIHEEENVMGMLSLCERGSPIPPLSLLILDGSGGSIVFVMVADIDC